MVDKPNEQNIFAAAYDALWHVHDHDGHGKVRAVLQTIIDLTPSPRTVDELTRILAQEGQPVAAAPEGETMQGRPYNPSTAAL